MPFIWAIAEFEGIDVWVNNAAMKIKIDDPVRKKENLTEMEIAKRTLNINFLQTLKITDMLINKGAIRDGGKILNMGSTY